MGNTQSSEGPNRPPLHSRVSDSSTATVTRKNSGKTTSSKEGAHRRRSIDLPDVYGKDLAFTPASPTLEPAELPSSPRWPKRGGSRSARGAPTGKSGKATPTVSSTLASAVSSHSSASSSLVAPAPVSSTTVPASAAPRQSIGMALDAAESQAAFDATQLGLHESSRSTLASQEGQEPIDKEDASGAKAEATPAAPEKALSPPLRLDTAAPFAVLPLLSPEKATPPSLPPSIPTMPPPLTPPLDTVLAPRIPASIVPLPLGTGASTTASLIVGQPLPIAGRTRTFSNEPGVPSPSTHERQPSNGSRRASPSPAVVVDEAHAAHGAVPIGLPASAFPLPANFADNVASPPTVMPAAAPIAGQSAALANDPLAQEAVLNATVDLDAGPDAVPTLLTWRPVEAGGEGGLADGTEGEGGAQPKNVYVTGTFAKGWTTKIEMRKKKSASEFTALVALPPGQHQLKFIVDKQWTTSRNLPSATDGEGNLINYLMVRAPSQHGPAFMPGVPWDDDADEGGEWGFEVPNPISTLGPDLDAWEAQRDARTDGVTPAKSYRIQLLESLRPPLLPAPLKDVPLNKALIVAQGSGDDNSILHKPDHSILDHLCASPIVRQLLSVAATKRYRRKFVTIIYIRPMARDDDLPLTA